MPSAKKEDIRIRIHAINECGYYQRGKQDRKFGNASSILRDLKSWIEGKNLNETSTYQDDDSSGTHSTYCYCIKSNTFGDYLVTTWNGISESSEAVASVAGNEPVGEAKVNLTEIPDGNIAGFATYFWIMPSLGKLATLRFSTSNRRNGLPEFRKYISNYMKIFSSYCVVQPKSISNQVTDKSEEDIEIAGYACKNGKPEQLIPKFSTVLHEKTSKNLKIIREERESIRRVVRKIELSRDSKYQADFVEKAFSWLGIKQIEKESRKFKFKYGIELHSPSAEDLEKIILSWNSKNNDSDSNWENLGFQLEGESKIRWIDSFLASEVFSLNIQRINEELIDADSLLTALSENRTIILDALGTVPIKQLEKTGAEKNETQSAQHNQVNLLSPD